MKKVKLVGEAGSADQEALREFLKYLFSVMYESVVWTSRCPVLMGQFSFKRMLTNLYAHMAFWLTKIL